MQKPRYMLLAVVFLYFLHSQVTPYFHFHHHNHQSGHEFISSSAATHHSGNNKLCCKAHSHDHKLVEADWNVLNSTKNVKVNISFDMVAILQDIDNNKPGYSKFVILPSCSYKLNSVLPKHSNKAPPLYI